MFEKLFIKINHCVYGGNMTEYLTCISDDYFEFSWIHFLFAIGVRIAIAMVIASILYAFGFFHIICRGLQLLFVRVYNFICPARWARRTLSQSEMEIRRKNVLRGVEGATESSTLPEIVSVLFEDGSDASRTHRTADDLSSISGTTDQTGDFDDRCQTSKVDDIKECIAGGNIMETVLRGRFGQTIRLRFPPLPPRADDGESSTNDAGKSNS